MLEDIRIGMEINLPKMNQRRVAMIKYFGELYNYRLIESTDVFKVNSSLKVIRFLHKLTIFFFFSRNFVQ